MPSPCTVTGNLQNLSSGKIAQGTVTFELANIGTGNPLGILGTSLFPVLKQQIQSAPDGSFTTSLWGNDNINPSNTIYNVTYRDSLGNSVGPIQYSIIGASANLNTLVAVNTTSPPVLIVGSLPLTATINLSAQSASIGTTVLYAVPSVGAGMYRLTSSIIASATGTGNVNPSVLYNNGSAKTIVGSTISLGALGNEAGNIFEFFSAASQNISYSTTYTATGSYGLRLRLEYLG
jgi:hypothetical protein